ncbi:single-stranded-DNA-specific exonuclease RecJ [Gayadomonas joobiniege]|uniref:single-stranded-DNA-specific exonuclease RecJ n=1 Tax=Gayadomonas joobiniege TaxID=1234606 RepID=UPI00036291C2|nr:single-stranded-DNA-specific exonuclease RecJ [Gayadomonas joobiniege]
MRIVRRQLAGQRVSSPAFHPILQRVLAHRGLQDEETELTLKRLSPPKLADLDKACDCLYQALLSQKKILIVGDFDADGATSTALCLEALQQMGSQALDFLVPNRFEFGYGLSVPLVDIAHQQGAQLIVTVDNGISCHSGVQRAKELGMQVIITDHHLPGDCLPEADAIVNPNRKDCQFPSKCIAGVGVAFYLMMALRSYLRQRNYFTERGLQEPNLASLLDLVALGTVADVVPLDDINRILVQQGINRIRSGYVRPGIRALLDVSKRDPRQLVSADFGFAVAPRLNAAGRLDDISVGIHCLLSNDYQQAFRLAASLDNLNHERKAIESSMQQEALKSLQNIQLTRLPSAIAMYQNDWHQGVIGILAGRLKERYHRPVAVFAADDNGLIKGSCRSIKGIHIRDLLERINTEKPGLIHKFGGHAMAAGLTISEADFEHFKNAFEKTVDQVADASVFDDVCWSDGPLKAADYTLELAQILKSAMPWGQAFEKPVFDDTFKVVQDRVLQDKHLKLVLQHPSGDLFDAIWFNYNPDIWHSSAEQAHVAFTLDINEFRGQKSVQLLVEAALPV